MASTASSDAASIRLIITGVASTGTRPLPMRGAVWASATTSSAWPCRPIGRCELGLGGFRHAGPHVAERDQTEQMHVVGRTRPGIVGFAERILGEPHGRL